MELPALDLNLIVVLQALLEERNVTRAGERVGISQPAASAALARLRRHFDDRLLERVGTRYELTPLAQSLHAELRETVERLSRLLAVQPRFEPDTSTRRFQVRCSDSVLAVLGPKLVAAVRAAAPAVGIDFGPLDPAVLDASLDVLGEVDVVVIARGLLSDFPSLDLYTDRWICVASADNTDAPDLLTPDDIAAAGWVVPYGHSPRASPADAHLAALGLDRHATITVQHFIALSRLVIGTDLLALAHERHLALFPDAALRRVHLPVELPLLMQAAYWHPRRQLDPGHRWLLDRLAEAAGALPTL